MKDRVCQTSWGKRILLGRRRVGCSYYLVKKEQSSSFSPVNLSFLVLSFGENGVSYSFGHLKVSIWRVFPLILFSLHSFENHQNITPGALVIIIV
jgi:hypothetical protein